MTKFNLFCLSCPKNNIAASPAGACGQNDGPFEDKQEIAAAKKAMRGAMLAKRASLDAVAKREMDQKIASRMLGLARWREAASVFLYVSLSDEADTRHLLELAWREGRLVGLPRIEDARKGIMRFYRCDGFGQLEKGPFSLLEPGPKCQPLEISPDLVILPGLAFAENGARLGYGKGFYDRYLAARSIAGSQLLGMCYSFQLVARLPQEKTDIPVHGICHDEGFLQP